LIGVAKTEPTKLLAQSVGLLRKNGCYKFRTEPNRVRHQKFIWTPNISTGLSFLINTKSERKKKRGEKEREGERKREKKRV
jgi:hypothetical protein